MKYICDITAEKCRGVSTHKDECEGFDFENINVADNNPLTVIIT